MPNNPLLATPNRTEQARTTKPFPNLPKPTNINHPNATISRKTRHILHCTAGEKFLFNHQPAAETAPRPNSDPPTNAARPQRTTPNGPEQARTTSAFPDLPKPTNINHPNATISRKARVFPLRTVEEFFLFDHQPASESPAHLNNAPAANLDESAASGRVV